MPETLVIGSGCAGLAAADVLKTAGKEVMVYEEKSYWGGHTHSQIDQGFIFDEGPHVSFTKNSRVRDLFTAGAGQVNEFEAEISNWFHGNWIKHPAQCHLYGLDPQLVTDCLVDFVASGNSEAVVNNYADWCIKTFGRAFAENFPLVYTEKYWTVSADQMSVDWIGPRMYPPSLAEVVRGAIQPQQEGQFHYLSSFRYPSSGGYQSFLNSMVHEEIIKRNKKVVSINPRTRLVGFADGAEMDYENLVSTMPLPELVKICDPGSLSSEIIAAAESLLCSSLVLVDIAVARADLSPNHWFYVYDEDISISRGHFPHLLSPSNAPPGMGSIQLEIYHSRHRPLPSSPASLPERAIDELVRMRILESADEVLWARHREVKYANVVFDHNRAEALSVLEPWAIQNGIILAGRYGEWGYHWTDDSVLSGWSAAEKILGSDSLANHNVSMNL